MSRKPKSKKSVGIPQKFESFRDVGRALDSYLRKNDPEFVRRSEHSSKRWKQLEPQGDES